MKKMPAGEARPLGTPKPSGPKGRSKRNLDKPFEEKSSIAKKKLDTDVQPEVDSSQVEAIKPTGQSAAKQQEKIMTLKLKNLSKNGKNAFYSGALTTLRFALSAFPGKIAPESFDVSDGIFADPKAAKVVETKEERKARLAALPKPTLAERIAKREAALEKDRAKLAAQAGGM